MGNWLSKQYENFSHGSFYCSESGATPKRRLLEADPRSPSANIERTPIMVGETPNHDRVQFERLPLSDTPTTAILPREEKKENALSGCMDN
ncbi:hypothetical protein TTRE_0000053601 [Trichuris trichiura]|uniref:Uncharacterized protein n=1 Tax=Trichuris trichiura TaxID=36087 RepID=A0A077YW48_TRITR|nr:hypothetical protein TTRE_0000053601 [Trichuris trichiura]